MAFAQLFQRSRFAAAVEGQVFAQSPVFAGEFGLKHSLPTASAPNAISVPLLDDPTLKKPIVHSAKTTVLALGIWKENFGSGGHVQQKKAQEEGPLALAPASSNKSLAALSQQEWAELLSKARKKRLEFQALVTQGVLSPDSWDAFLGIEALLKTPQTPSVHPPTYSTPTPEADSDNPLFKVQGRILNSVADGFAVGIAGLVAFLPKREATIDELLRQRATPVRTSSLPVTASSSSSLLPLSTRSVGPVSRNFTIDRESLFDFYVTKAAYDEHGRPDIILSMKAPVHGTLGGSTPEHPFFFSPAREAVAGTTPSNSNTPPRTNLHVMSLLQRLKDKADAAKTDKM